MDKSSSTNPSPKEKTQHSSSRIRVRKIPSTPRPEVMTPPTSQAMVLPTTGATQPSETSMSESYLRIIKDMMGKFSPAGKMSDFLTHMADEIRKKETNPSPLPLEIPTDAATLTETSAAQIPVEQTTSQNPSPTTDPARHDENQEDEAEVDEGEEGNSKREGEVGAEEEEEDQGNEERENKEEPVERNSIEKEREVIVLEEKDSSDNGETLDERALRRNLRTRRRLETTEHRGVLEEAAAIATAERQAVERKRRGKQIATPSKKRRPRQASRTVVIQEPIENLTQTPYCQVEEGDEEQSEGAKDTSDSEGVYEKMEVTVDQKLLEAMVYFKDPKKRRECAGRGLKGKKAKSGKRLHLPSLRGLESEDQFLAYIKAIGFEWLLEHSLVEVPVNLAREFFTSFHFKHTTDLGADSIRFRVFNQEIVMNLREWSLSLGLLSQEEDNAGAWTEREIGHPEDTEGFSAKEAWGLITTKDAAPFKTSVSKGADIKDPVLRLSQVFLAHKLLGQANRTITTPELYFMWCMLTGVKVHLGYWVARACHNITTHPVRHLCACHLLGAYLQRNIVMKLARPRPSLLMCDTPDWFDINFFINTGLVERDESGKLQFYAVGQAEETPVEVEQETEVQPAPAEARPTATEERWQKMMEDMLRKLGEATAVYRGLLELQTDKITKALTLMERTVALAEKNSQLAQQLASPTSASKESQPQKATPETIPIKPTRKRKEVTTTSQSTEKESEEPTPSTLKKVKLERTRQLTRKSGSQGS